MVPATSGSDPASKKAEIRARRFGARDKTKKLSAAIPPGGGAAAAAVEAVASEGSGGGVGGGEPVAQSLQALKRRGEAVEEDLGRTRTGLAELELEEAEEAGEAVLADGGGDDSVVDPLDMFMSENRRKERQQAMSRLTAKRDALLEEQARLKVMTEAARPSMPSLKTSAPAATAADAAGGVSAKGGAESDSTDGMGSSTLDRGTTAKLGDTIGTNEETGSNRSDQGQVPKKGRGGVDTDDIEEEDNEELAPPPNPEPPSSSTPASVKAGRSSASPRLGAGAQSGVDEGDQVKIPNPTPSGKEASRVSGAKRRGTPVGASMLPPPPAKRSQQIEKTSAPAAAPAGEESGGGGRSHSSPSGPTAKRKVKGPAAMPPPLGKPSASSAGAVASSGGKTAVGRSWGAAGGGVAGKATGKDVLEGGDVDWVPPTNALEKMAALNKKFGY